MSKIDPKKLSYEGCDLEAMAAADNYYAWIIDQIKPYIGNKIVEVGAGAGSFSKQILKLRPKEAVFVEPTKNMHKLLTEKVNSLKPKQTKATLHRAYMKDVINKVGRPDTFIYINVFEHIEDDVKELKMLAKTISKDGHIIIFVPALKSLLSDFDKSIGHYRRYDKKMLRELADKAGLNIVRLKYFDMIGIIPWFLNFKLLRSKKINPQAVGFYDKAAVPVVRAVETVVPVPIGKNLLLIAQAK